MSGIKRLIEELCELPAVGELARHADTHRDPVAVIAYGSLRTECEACARRWLAARDVVAAFAKVADTGDAPSLAVSFLTGNADTVAAWHGIATNGTRGTVNA